MNFDLIRALQNFRFIQFVRVVKTAKIDEEYIKMHLNIAPLQQATRIHIIIKRFNVFYSKIFVKESIMSIKISTGDDSFHSYMLFTLHNTF